MKIELSDNEKLLVVAPHPDDESIGCGGVLCTFKSHCDVLLVTDGVTDFSENQQLASKRITEFQNAMKICGINQSFLLHIPEKQIPSHFDKFLSIDYSVYKYIFVPNRYEYHKDHIDTYASIKKAIKKKHVKTHIIEYEVWTTIRFPNIYFDISGVTDKKTEAINQHESQTASLDYVKLIMGLNAYRGLSKCYEYAEAYYCEAEKKKERIRHIKRRIRTMK